MPEELHDILQLITFVATKRDELDDTAAVASCDELLQRLYQEFHWAAAGYAGAQQWAAAAGVSLAPQGGTAGR